MPTKRPRKSRRQWLLDQLRVLTTEGNGLCSLAFYNCNDIAGLKVRVLDGDRRARSQFRAIGEIVKDLSARTPPCCALCDEVVDNNAPPKLIAVLQACCDHPTRTFSNAICGRCAAEHPTQAALREAIVAFYREHAEADLRVLPSAPFPPGHA